MCYYCFCMAIQSPSTRVLDLVAVKDIARLVNSCIWAFSSKNTAGYKEDYHKVFKSENYLQWWTNQVLVQLTKFFYKNTKFCTLEATVTMVSGSIQAFLQKNTAGYKGDDHKALNKENYLQWTNQLLVNLAQPSIVILDHAKYYLIFCAHVPRQRKIN